MKKLTILLLWTLMSSLQGYGQLWPAGPEGIMAGEPVSSSSSPEPGLLFYLSGNKGLTADYAAGGQVLPNFLKDVKVIPGGAYGPGFQAENTQLLTYWAPGNIFAQRGTISFFWRSRYPVGPTPFPVFRVAFADNSSWDMVWLRIDYNGGGFDAFVTDIGLSRTRVSYYMDKFPGPEEWIHLALAWDETLGIKFYVNGKLAAEQISPGYVYDTGLDQFGPHSRIISPYQVQSEYNFRRGGDFDELRIYDRMLSDEAVAGLASGNIPVNLKPFRRDLSERQWRDEWWLLNGWNLPNEAPPVLPSAKTSVRKIEIHDAYDIKRWYWKANDGIRETTWPGVYNMSSLPGRYDYFVLPDWDCYSVSGQTVRFTMPEEPWNHIEMWGRAWGQLTLETENLPDNTFAVRTRNQVKSWHRIAQPQTGGKIRFDNAVIEEPIGSFDAYYVIPGMAPQGINEESFIIRPAPAEFRNKAIEEVASFIRGRYPSDERTMMTGVPANGKETDKTMFTQDYSIPLIHIIIPYSGQKETGLDGVEIALPEMKVKPTHNGLFPMNIRIKDPLWQMRDLADFSFSIKPGESPVIWLDTRDRILPSGKALYITIAGAGATLTPELLNGMTVRLVYKSRQDTRAEHEIDRFTQVRDNFAHIVEEHPTSPRLNLYNRFVADCRDLLSVNPDHQLAQSYLFAGAGGKRPEYKIPECPQGTPEWAFLQIRYLEMIDHLASWYIDNRQIANGEFGGGLSDDGDMTNMWPGIALMGIQPDKMLVSLRLHMAAYFDQERPAADAVLKQRSLPLFTNGLATIFTDELHALEDGIQVENQLCLLDYGNPLYIERSMHTAKRLLEDITGINPAGHRHFLTRYYSGTRIATEQPWENSVNHSYHVLQSAYMVAWYNGNKNLCNMITGLADGLLAHSRNGKLLTAIDFPSDSAKEDTGLGSASMPWSLFTAARELSGDSKYPAPPSGRNSYVRGFNQGALVQRYREDITSLGVREYINTYGSTWIDRVNPYSTAIQQDRLGGIALARVNTLYPLHKVSWRFLAPADYKSVAICVSKAETNNLEIVSYNIDNKQVTAEMTLWNIKPGKWRIRQGTDRNEDQIIDGNLREEVRNIERGDTIRCDFEPDSYHIITMELVEPADIDRAGLPDLAIGPSDIKVDGNHVTVKIHNLGNATSEESFLELADSLGKLAASAKIPAIDAPSDLVPEWKEIMITLPEGSKLNHYMITIDPGHKLKQITRLNDNLKW